MATVSGPERSASRPVGASVVAVAAAVAVVAVLGTIGADARWVAALGEHIVRTRALPDGIPYATAPSDGWTNPLVLAELVFHGAEAALGERGLLLAQVAAVAIGFTLLGVAARRRGAGDAGVAIALLVAAGATLGSIVVVRLQLFSLVAFPLLLTLLYGEQKRPSRRIWLLIPLLAVWGNLHGAVLIGVAVAGAYLLLERARSEPLGAGGVLVAAVAAVAANPALHRTPEYYLDVLESEAARRGVGLWEPLSFSPFDLVLVAGSVLLVALAVRASPRAWEIAALAGLAFLTLRTARSGVWLAFAAAVPAAGALRSRGALRTTVAGTTLAALVLVSIGALVRGPIETGASGALLRTVLGYGQPALAEPLIAEQIVLAGGRVWVANPLDAFRREDQALYLDWATGKPAGDAAIARAGVVVVREGSPAQQRAARNDRLREAGREGRAVLYVVPEP